jgi:hypothetical protein
MRARDSEEGGVLVLRLCGAAVHAAERATLPARGVLVPNAFALYVHPAYADDYEAWTSPPDPVDFPDAVEELLSGELGAENSSYMLGQRPYRVWIWTVSETTAPWRLRVDHFSGESRAQIAAYATHLDAEQWHAILDRIPLSHPGDTGSDSDDTNETAGPEARLVEAFREGRSADAVEVWSSCAQIAPLHVDLQLLYAVALHESPATTARPPFDCASGVLGFIETQGFHDLALRMLVDGYGDPGGTWRADIDRGLDMLAPHVEIARQRYGDEYGGPLRYWSDALTLLAELPELLGAGGLAVGERLDALDAEYGPDLSGTLRLPPLMWAGLLAAGARGQTGSMLDDLSNEVRIRGGAVFGDAEELGRSWSAFAHLLPERMNLAQFANQLGVHEKALVACLADPEDLAAGR